MRTSTRAAGRGRDDNKWHGIVNAQAFALNEAWCGDITYIRTWQGWLYRATVIDLGSRRVVGWAMADHMRAELVIDALKMAVTSRQPGAGTIFHSDRGSQYTSGDFRALLGKHKLRQSLSRPGQCWDNAVAESWFATLKDELIDRHVWPTRARARQAIFEFIEGFYNRRRHTPRSATSARRSTKPGSAWPNPTRRYDSMRKRYPRLRPWRAHVERCTAGFELAVTQGADEPCRRSRT